MADGLDLPRRHLVHVERAQSIELTHATLADQTRTMKAQYCLMHLAEDSALTLLL
jgi:hypothetical protein